MRCKIKCGSAFEMEVVVGEQKKDAINSTKVAALVFIALMTMVIGLAAHGAVKGDFTAYEKSLDTIVKVVELLTHGR
ncbi:hypothetical protein SAMN05216428_11570 [Nitrosospira sp. Nsp11]|uniref:hypothetical protein n=1 Tax=Nitrosospira sp. Nsp11 TaxID=1855338 RepID=UPI000916256F|nr:hypothetical protein [Nitrosospira sp. Nsp11]SHM15528.1 hypothetical protein SAMN05216428_11570 [Nitrosospira sp. Nsp11]